MWQAAIPMAMDYMGKRKAAEQDKRRQAAMILQQSASRMGAPSTAQVGAAGAIADDKREQRSQFADLMMQLSGAQPMGQPVDERGKMARLLMQMSGGYGRGGGGF